MKILTNIQNCQRDKKSQTSILPKNLAQDSKSSLEQSTSLQQKVHSLITKTITSI